MKIAVISDTHGLLRTEVLDIIRECDGLIHGGDINSQNVIDEILKNMKARAPVYFVRGNNDREWAEYLAKHQEFTLDGVNFYLVHNKKDLPWNLGNRQIVIYGHSHKYAEEEKDGRLWLNPGSCGRRRFNQDITMALLYLENGKWRVERIDIPHEEKREVNRTADVKK
ncbi:MAG: metallophosphoesterase family protein [Blautia sp.]